MNLIFRISVPALAVAVIASCASPPRSKPETSAATPDGAQQQTVRIGAGASAPNDAQPQTAQISPDLSAPAPGANVAGQARTFSTQMATYTAVGFESVPGWQRDDFTQSWPAFRASCQVLNGRGDPWRQICANARQVDAKNTAAIRGFFEREFAAYQIRDDDRRPDGVVTGYFESEIAGSRVYKPPFIYPVYGEPADMLFLDARKAPPGKGVVAARVQGRQVVVQPNLSTRDLGGPGLYALDLSLVTRDALDRKVRLRADGRNLRPYYTREEIETRGVPNARVLAFVSSPMALYEMQIQGSGRIRLSDGAIIRLGYAEQNGHPFRPTLAQNAKGRSATAVRTRGGVIELEVDDDDTADDDTGNGIGSVRVRGFNLALPAKSGPVLVPGQRIAGVTGSGISDPSYVFFKELASIGGGPVGALGVPLSPGRSIAVDPRATPLGYPVFVSTRMPGSDAPAQRLTVAQDTGGAIRGAVRADYFFGNGQEAVRQARRMKERGQMWVLLPRGQVVAATRSGAIRTRGGAGNGLPQCLVPEEGACVDD